MCQGKRSKNLYWLPLDKVLSLIFLEDCPLKGREKVKSPSGLRKKERPPSSCIKERTHTRAFFEHVFRPKTSVMSRTLWTGLDSSHPLSSHVQGFHLSLQPNNMCNTHTLNMAEYIARTKIEEQLGGIYKGGGSSGA